VEDIRILEEMLRRTLEIEELERMWFKSQVEELAKITAEWVNWINFSKEQPS